MEVGVQLHSPAALLPEDRAPVSHWIRGWVGPRICLDYLLERKVLFLPALELLPHDHPARLSYLGSVFARCLTRATLKLFVVVLSLSCQMSGYYFQMLSQPRPFSPFQFIMYQSTYHSVLHVLSYRRRYTNRKEIHVLKIAVTRNAASCLECK
jgi:hypothetical protein